MNKIEMHIDNINILMSLYSYNSSFNNINSLLHSFHKYDHIYENDFESYVSYIFYSVINQALLQNKSILNYEHYVYNVLTGYGESVLNTKPKPSLLANIWVSITKAYDLILSLSSNLHVSSIDINKKLYCSYTFINTPKKFPLVNFYFNAPVVMSLDDKIQVILILPYMDTYKYNLNIISLIKRYGSLLDKIHILNINNSKLGYVSLNITDSVINLLNKNIYIDINLINIPDSVENYIIYDKDPLQKVFKIIKEK